MVALSLGFLKRHVSGLFVAFESMEGNGWLVVDVRRFHELHGGLGFMSQVLVWNSAIPGTGICY